MRSGAARGVASGGAAVVTGDGAYAFGLEGGSSNLVSYGSRESANAPQLLLEVAD